MTGADFVFADDVTAAQQDQVRELLNRWAVDLAGPVQVTRLTGGASNVNLKLAAADRRLALRLCMPDSDRWGVDRAAAIQAQSDAAALNVAPRVIAHDLPHGHLLSEFVDGTTVTSATIRSQHLLPAIAGTLRQLNAGTTTARDFSPFDDMRTFVELGSAENAPRPAGLDEMLGRATRVEALFRNRPAPRAFCHSDLVPQNFINTAAGLRLVDFDYAGNGWVAFEMASLTCQAELNAEETEEFLTAYDPNLDDGQRARVELMRMVAGVREATWATMAEPLLGEHTSPLPGWTYQGYATANLEQARQVVALGFDELLSTARVIRDGARF